MSWVNKNGEYIGGLKHNFNLDLGNTNLKILADNMTINGFLYLNGLENFKKLPKKLTVTHLYACHTGITEIPSDLIVKGNCDISYTGVKEIPETIDIWGDLDVRYTEIDVNAIPEHVVGGKIIMDKTQEQTYKKGTK